LTSPIYQFTRFTKIILLLELITSFIIILLTSFDTFDVAHFITFHFPPPHKLRPSFNEYLNGPYNYIGKDFDTVFVQNDANNLEKNFKPVVPPGRSLKIYHANETICKVANTSVSGVLFIQMAE